MSDARAEAWTEIAGSSGRGGAQTGGILIVADHASNHVPADIDLGIDPAILDRHVAIDIGVAPLAVALCESLACGGILAGVSRLVCDLNREEDAPGLVPLASDGIAIPGNALGPAARAARVARFFRPYHAAIEAAIARHDPALLVSLHSFTPQLDTRPDEQRPWHAGILYNEDDRAARIAIPLLEAAGIVTGDNEPYSGRVLNATMNRHGEAAGRPYLGIEVRQDQIEDASGVARWAVLLESVIGATWDSLVRATAEGS